MFRVALVPAGQYWAGRQCSSLSVNQRHAPATPFEVVTVTRFSTSARNDFATGLVNCTTTGMPTP